MTDGKSSAEIEQLFAAATADIIIPPRPEILRRITEVSQSTEPDLSVVADLIQQDVALSAGMLRLANSPFFGLRVRARTAQQAIMMLGMELSVSALTGMVLRRSFPPSRPMERFWDASARTAQISGWLTQQPLLTTGVDQGDAYTFALFRDCGIAVMMTHYGDQYLQTLQLANQDSLQAFTEIERQRHPTTHNVIGCLLARSWFLPEISATAIRHHHDLDMLLDPASDLPAESRQLIALAQLAERIMQINSGMNAGCEWDKLGPFCLQTLTLPVSADEELAELAANVEESNA